MEGQWKGFSPQHGSCSHDRLRNFVLRTRTDTLPRVKKFQINIAKQLSYGFGNILAVFVLYLDNIQTINRQCAENILNNIQVIYIYLSNNHTIFGKNISEIFSIYQKHFGHHKVNI